MTVEVRDGALSEVESTIREAKLQLVRALPKLDDILIQTGTRPLDAVRESAESGLARDRRS